MPGDPKECRENALRCTELAHRSQNPEPAELFSNLAKQWVKLAVELEHAEALREGLSPVPRTR
jgi:hypothetical protein